MKALAQIDSASDDGTSIEVVDASLSVAFLGMAGLFLWLLWVRRKP